MLTRVSEKGLTAFSAPTSLKAADETEKSFSICLQRAVKFSPICKAEPAEVVTGSMTALYKC